MAGSVADEGAVTVCSPVVEGRDDVSTVLGSSPTALDVGLGDAKLEGASGFSANEVVVSARVEGLAGVEALSGVEGPARFDCPNKVEGATGLDVTDGLEEMAELAPELAKAIDDLSILVSV
jgi:hypothetical protein